MTKESVVFDEKKHELIAHLRNDLIHVLLGVTGVILFAWLHWEIGEWLSLTYVFGSLTFTAVRYIKRLRYLRKIAGSQSTLYPIRAASPRDFPVIEDIDRGWLGNDRAALIPAHAFAAWSERNPESFWVHVDTTGEVKGYYSLLHVKPATFAKFKSGSIAEPLFKGSDILPPSHDRAAEELYFFSIAHREHGASSVGPYLLLRHAADKIAYLQNYGRLERLYAASASQLGTRLIKGLPFSMFMEQKDRVDGHDLYELDLTKHDTRVLVDKLGRRGTRSYVKANTRRRT